MNKTFIVRILTALGMIYFLIYGIKAGTINFETVIVTIAFVILVLLSIYWKIKEQKTENESMDDLIDDDLEKDEKNDD